MGQALSEHDLFLGGLSKALKVRGIKVKTKELLQYFQFIHKICPWFSLEGSIDSKRWERVGDALKDYYRVFGPEKIPVTTFTYWNLISELLVQRHSDPQIEETVAQGEAALQDSRNPSPKPPMDNLSESSHPGLVVLDMPEPLPDGNSPPLPSRGMCNDSHNDPAIPPPAYQHLYPNLSDFQEVDWSQLAEEAAQYHSPPVMAPAAVKLPPGLPRLPGPSPALLDLESESHDLQQVQLQQEKQRLIL